MRLSPTTVAVYTGQALSGMEQALARFDDSSVHQRPHGQSTNSAAALITHACASSTWWLAHVGLGRDVARDRDAEFVAESTVIELQALLVNTRDRLAQLAADLESGPTDDEHELRVLLPEGDTSNAALVLHALEELFQHLGHLELTADAICGPRI
jgi:hypothetical protein